MCGVPMVGKTRDVHIFLCPVFLLVAVMDTDRVLAGDEHAVVSQDVE